MQPSDAAQRALYAKELDEIELLNHDPLPGCIDIRAFNEHVTTLRKAATPPGEPIVRKGLYIESITDTVEMDTPEGHVPSITIISLRHVAPKTIGGVNYMVNVNGSKIQVLGRSYLVKRVYKFSMLETILLCERVGA